MIRSWSNSSIIVWFERKGVCIAFVVFVGTWVGGSSQILGPCREEALQLPGRLMQHRSVSCNERARPHTPFQRGCAGPGAGARATERQREGKGKREAELHPRCSHRFSCSLHGATMQQCRRHNHDTWTRSTPTHQRTIDAHATGRRANPARHRLTTRRPHYL